MQMLAADGIPCRSDAITVAEALEELCAAEAAVD